MNETFRHKKGPTDVLSFPSDDHKLVQECSAGTLAGGFPVRRATRSAQAKSHVAPRSRAPGGHGFSRAEQRHEERGFSP